MMNADRVEKGDPQESSSDQSHHLKGDARYKEIEKDLANRSSSTTPSIFQRLIRFFSSRKSKYKAIEKDLQKTLYPPAPPEETRNARYAKWRTVVRFATIICLIAGSLLIGSGLVFDRQSLLQFGSYVLLLVFFILFILSCYQVFSTSNDKAGNQRKINQETLSLLAKEKGAKIINVLNSPWQRSLILFFAIMIVAAHLFLAHYFRRYFVPLPGWVDPRTGILYAVDFPMNVAPEEEATFFVTLTNPTTDTIKGVTVTLVFSDTAQISLTGQDSANVLEFGDLTSHHRIRKGISFQVEKFAPVAVSAQLYLATQDIPMQPIQNIYRFGIAPHYLKRALQEVLGWVSIVVSVVVGLLKEILQLPD